MSKRPPQATEAIKESNPFSNLRNARITLLLTTLKGAQDKPLNEVVATFSMQEGISTRKVREYLALLRDTKKIKIEPHGTQEFVRIIEA